MTMMHSDSESQDSDDGRRFRFEATRKDSNTINLNRQQRKTSPLRPQPRRSRSRDRSRHDRKDDRSNYERKKESQSNRDDRRGSKEHKNRDDSRRKDEIKHRDDLRHKNFHKDSSWESSRRDSRSRDSRDFKNRDNKRRKSRDKSYDKNRDIDNHKNRERGEKRQSKDRDKSNKKLRSSVDDDKGQMDDDDDNDRISIEAQDCKDLNLSDFDIVSDTEQSDDSSKSNRESWKNDLEDKNRRKITRSRDDNKVKNPKNGDNKSSHDDSNSDNELSDGFVINASTSAPSTCSFHHNKNNNLQSRSSNVQILDKSHDNNEVIHYNDELIDDKNVKINILDDDDDDEECYGPILPPTLVKPTSTVPEQIKIIGPCLPDDFRLNSAQRNDDKDDDDEDDDEIFGPSLPLSSNKSEGKTIGPTIPDYLRQSLITENEDNDDNDKIGDEAMDEDDDILGPLPVDHPGIDNDRIQQQLEYRARLIKKELAKIDYNEEKKREEWMTELPSVQAANLGLGPRKFRTREGPDMSDRSGWTDTPADRVKKQAEMLMGKKKSDNDDDNDKPIKKIKSSKREGETLLEMHEKKMRKKKKKEEKKAKKAGTTVRRPFDRDIDMQVNRFDEARKRNIITKAQSLDDRFSRGKI